MEKYIGVKMIEAEPCTVKEFNKIRPLIYSGECQDGYKVKYPDGYESWSPKNVFEEAYRKTDNMNFGLAVEALKKGYRVAHKGWNGKEMCLIILKSHELVAESEDGRIGAKEYLVPGDKELSIVPAIYIKTVNNKLVPWVTSQIDVLADDWQLIE